MKCGDVNAKSCMTIVSKLNDSKVSAAKFPHLCDGPEDAHTVREDPIRRVVFSEFSREPLNHFCKLFAELLQA